MSTESNDRREVIEALHAEGVEAAQNLGASLSHKADRRDVWRVGVVASCLSAAVAIAVSAGASYQIVDLRAQRTAEQLKVEAEQKSTREAISSLEEANRDLRARGQQPVTAPDDLQSEETLVAAATARVLAALPPAPMPTDQQISNAVAAHLLGSPVRVSAYEIATQVSAYLAANPPAPGTQGERGEKGDPGRPGIDGKDGADGEPPTPEEIMAVFNVAASQNPDLLCAGKGRFTEVRGFVQVPPDVVPQERAFWVCLPE